MTGGTPVRFAALRNRDSRPYLFAAGLSMMGDNIEHVITYWVLWERFHSPVLAGFEVVSHWLPFLLLSVYFGSLAERFDCRRVIQVAQGLFMLVSLVWGVLFLTDSLQMWQACVLLVLHGMAGSLWGPAEQLMLHDFVEREDLPSAVRLNATFRSLGVLAGPAVGSGLLLLLGPELGILCNVLFYLPMTILMARTRFTGHTRADAPRKQRLGLADSLRVLREVRSNRPIVSMIVLSGLTALTVGSVLSVSMPTFALELGAETDGLAYGVLLFANGAGGVLGGFLLEATGAIRPNTRSALVTTVVFAATTLVFAVTSSYALAVAMLVVGGVANIASASVAQSVIQLEAPPGDRGRVYGVFGMFGSGMRTFSGVTLAVLGTAFGIPGAVAVSAVVMGVGTVVLWVVLGARGRRGGTAAHER